MNIRAPKGALFYIKGACVPHCLAPARLAPLAARRIGARIVFPSHCRKMRYFAKFTNQNYRKIRHFAKCDTLRAYRGGCLAPARLAPLAAPPYRACCLSAVVVCSASPTVAAAPSCAHAVSRAPLACTSLSSVFRVARSLLPLSVRQSQARV